MLIFDEHSKTVVLDSIYTPVATEYFWALDFEMMDYTLSSLNVLEETICSSIVVRIKGFDFVLPATWNMLVVADETQQLDVIEVSGLAGREFNALVYGPNYPMPKAYPVVALDYLIEFKNVSPVLNKHQMLCHPIGPNEWVNVSPSDSYNKYLRNVTTGDIIS